MDLRPKLRRAFPWIGAILNAALRSLARQKLRAALSGLGVVCGVTALFAMICIGEGAKREAVRQIEALGARNILIKAKDLTKEQKTGAVQSLSLGLTPQDARRIMTALPTANQAAMLRVVKAAVMGAPLAFTPQILAATSNYAQVMAIGTQSGRFFNGREQEEKSLVCVLGHNAAAALGPRGKVGELLRIENLEFRIVGVLSPSGSGATKALPAARDYNQAVFIPMDSDRSIDSGRDQSSFQRVRWREEGEIGEIAVQIRRTDQVAGCASVIRRIMAIQHHGAEDYSVIAPLEIMASSRRAQRAFNIVLGAIAGISLLAGGVGIMNIMLAAISERKREIGVRRAVGASQGHILAHFLAESMLLTLAGGAAGVAIGLIFVLGVAFFAGWEIVVAGWAIALSLGMAGSLGAAFGCYPAYLAATTDPIEALRGMG